MRFEHSFLGRKKKMRKSLCALFVIALTVVPTLANQITYTDSISGLFRFVPDRDLVVSQFDSSLGTLNSVSIAASTALQAELGFENIKTTGGGTFSIYTYWPSDPTQYTYADINLSFNSSNILTSGYSDAHQYTKTLAVFDGTIDYAGTSGAILANFSDADNTSMFYNSSLAQFIGTGNLTFGLLTNAFTALSVSGGNGATSMATIGQASVSVTYDYTPVPEPVTLAILSIGGLLLRRKIA
jgi:hypothetical protein